jgi:ribosomal protein S12 methylthiotransferase
MPLQHGSTEMLQVMRRGITREKTEILLDKIRQKIPEIALRTTLIVGHPHETQAHFEEMYEFVEKMRFDRLGVFTYSHEEHTHAYTMPDNVPEEVKQERAAEIMALQQEISWELNQEKIGRTFQVLFDRKEAGYFIGRTQYDSPEVDNEVLVKADKNTRIKLGDFANVKILEAQEFDLFGEIIG